MNKSFNIEYECGKGQEELWKKFMEKAPIEYLQKIEEEYKNFCKFHGNSPLKISFAKTTPEAKNGVLSKSLNSSEERKNYENGDFEIVDYAFSTVCRNSDYSTIRNLLTIALRPKQKEQEIDEPER